MSTSSKTFDIFFEVRNKVTNKVMLTKSYNCTINLMSDSSINSGTIDGEEDKNIGDNDKNIFDGLNENSSLDDILNTIKESFETFKLAFSILPGFIWTMIASTLFIIIILRVLGR